MNSDAEINKFKEDINLIEYAKSFGYKLDTEKTHANVTAMKGPSGTLNIKRDSDNHWVYNNWTTGKQGSVIDFHQEQTSHNLGKTRVALRVWAGSPTHRSPNQDHLNSPSPQKRQPSKTESIDKIKKEYESFTEISSHPYLKSRGISKNILNDIRFKATFRKDDRGNVIFPYINKDGVSGYEKRNKDFKGFSQNGERSLWFSRTYKGDKTLVVVESPIDALSYAQIHGKQEMRYVATGGSVGKNQEELLSASIRRMSERPDAKLLIATDRDKAGDLIADKIKALAKGHNISVDRITPKFKDWNEDLNQTKTKELSPRKKAMGRSR